MKSRPPFEPFYVYLLLALIGYAVADLTLLNIRDQLIPNTPPPVRPAARGRVQVADRGALEKVTRRNLFNADGKIPNPLADRENEAPKVDDPPVPSNLPLALVGTIVHANPARSVATITLKNGNVQESFQNLTPILEGGREIATLTTVERNKVIFRNLATGKLEYIEMREDAKIQFGVAKPIVNGEVTVKGETEFEISRTDINKLTSDLPSLLQQARAVPEIGPDGRVIGFRVMDMQPGSIYERLGIKRGDVIKSVNGEPVDSPAKAMELYNALKSSSNIQLGVDRQGRNENMNFNITN